MPFRFVPSRDRKLNRLVKWGAETILQREASLYAQADPARYVYLVREGHVRLVHTETGSEQERTVEVVGPGEVFGDEALLPGAHRSTGARAGEPSRVVALPGREVAQTLRTAPRTFEAYLSGKEADLAHLRRLVIRKRRGHQARMRVGSVLLELGRRLGVPQEGGVLLPIRLTHQTLADLSGCHRSTVTTLLNDWIYHDALIQQRGQLVILDADQLA